MKTKIYLLIIILSLLALNAPAQELFRADFSAGISGWSTEGDYPENWQVSETNHAGGETPELFYKGKYPMIAPDKSCRLISPIIDLSSYPGTSLLLRFCHAIECVSPIKMEIATTFDGGATWHNVWTQGEVIERQMFVRIDNTGFEAGKLQFAFVCSGNFQELKGWYIDDLELSIEPSNAIHSESITCGKESIFLKEGNPISLSFKNIGKAPITSLEIGYQVDDDEPVMEIRTGLNVAHFETSMVTFQEPVVGKGVGEHSVKVWVSKVNGASVSEQALYGSFSVTDIPLVLNKRKAMLEEFTSSTCNPCARLNEYLNPWLETVKDQIVVASKYQMNWPSPGDIYYIQDCKLRSGFYGGITSVPTPLINGGKFPSSITYPEMMEKADILVKEISVQSVPVDIKAVFSIKDRTIKTEMHLMPYVSGNYLLLVSVNEKTTTENVAGNGETAFHSVVMKMLPDGNGQTVSLVEGKLLSITLEADLTDTNVEEFDDLEVAIWVQDRTTREVLNANYAVESTFAPNMPKNLQAAVDEMVINLSWDKPSTDTGLVGYKLLRDGVVLADNITGTTYTDGNANGDYLYHLCAVYPDIESSHISATAAVTMPISAPTNVEAATQDRIHFTLTWDASPEEYIEGYDIYREGTKINRELVTSTTYTDEAPYEGGYCYRVVAVAPMGKSEPSARACAGPVAIEDTTTNNSLKVYPNPTDGQLRITADGSTIKTIQLFDLSGRLLYERSNINAAEYLIDVSEFIQGMYILNADGKAVKFIKQ